MADALLAFRQAGVTELYGNLLTVPAGNGLLYVQPIYTQRESASGTGTYPQLQFVLASFGTNVGIGQTLEDALDDALGTTTEEPSDPGDNEPPPPDNQPPTPPPDNQPPGEADDAAELLQRADRLYEQATAALDAQDLGEYQRLVEKSNALVARALDLLGQEAPAEGGGSAPSEESPPADEGTSG